MPAETTPRAANVALAARHPFEAIVRRFPYWHLVAAISLGLGLRLFFIFHFPFYAGDTKFYDELARNLLDHRVYGLFVQGQLTPVDMRMPGYPMFLAALYAVLGRSSRAVMVVQAFIDLITCILTALIAGIIAPARDKIRVATIALWMAALCPFTANYSAAVLSEILATFLTTLAALIFVIAFTQLPYGTPSDSSEDVALGSRATRWFATGMIVGLGTLVRPETPLLLLAAGLVLAACWRRRVDWPKLFLAISWISAGLILTLTPWAARNARTMGRIEFLAPRYAQSFGDFMPRGFYAWTGTWMVRFKDAYLVTWKLGKDTINFKDFPASAFDSNLERARVQALIARYNGDLQMSPLLDREFATLARERRARHPMRTYIEIPSERIAAIWLTPRVALLPYSGKVWPIADSWRNNRTDMCVTAAFGILNIIYLGMALIGAWRVCTQPAVAFLILAIIVRTVFLTQLQTVEPRYVIVCYPMILALGALAWSLPSQQAAFAAICSRTPKTEWSSLKHIAMCRMGPMVGLSNNRGLHRVSPRCEHAQINRRCDNILHRYRWLQFGFRTGTRCVPRRPSCGHSGKESTGQHPGISCGSTKRASPRDYGSIKIQGRANSECVCLGC